MGFQRVTAIGNASRLGTNTARLENQIELLLNKYASDANDLLLQPTRTWKNHAVAFSREFRRDSRGMYNVIFTDSDVFFWLNYGTSKRFAVLSGDWSSKTSVGSLAAGEGSGSVVAISKIAMAGIKAREWTNLVVEKLQPQFTQDMQQIAFAMALKR